MPFLRAARIKKNLQPEIERVKVVPTLILEEQTEPEEEFTPTQIEDLHRLIDIRTKEAEQKEPEFLQPENVIVVVPEFVPEAETIILDAESVQEIPESEDESFAPESELLQPDESQEVTPEIIAPESEHEHETVTPEAEIEPEISQPESESAQETSQPEASQEVTAENLTPEFDTEPEISQTESESAQESSQPELSQEVTDETITQEAEIETEDSQTESESSQEELTENETITPESEAQEPEISQAESESEAGIFQEDSNTASTDFDENSILDEPSQNETPNLEAETVTETPEPEQEIITPENESESSQEESHEQLQEDSQPAKTHKDYSGSQLNYDFTSGERYVDKVSTKTEFDKMLDELANISKELLSWQADKFARDYTGKFQEGESSQAEARKYEAFLGGYITNAAMMLYDKGYREAAVKQLEQAKSILDARKKLEDETSAIKSRVEEQNDSVDLSDILGLFGDG